MRSIAGLLQSGTMNASQWCTLMNTLLAGSRVTVQNVKWNSQRVIAPGGSYAKSALAGNPWLAPYKSSRR